MAKPIIGMTCHTLAGPVTHASIGSIPRSAVNQHYIDAIASGGGAVVCIPLGMDRESLLNIYAILDGLLLPGGDDVAPERYGHDRHPQLGSVDDYRDEMEIFLATQALHDGLPVLGICRGIQVLAVAAGGTLYQDLPSEFESHIGHDVRDYGRDYQCHTINIASGTHLTSAVGCSSMLVNSFHHQAVRDLPTGFMVSALSDDGVIEAIESVGHPFAVGIQCHPEGMWQTTGPQFVGLFRAFVQAAESRSARLQLGA